MFRDENIFQALQKLDSATYNHSIRVRDLAREIECYLEYDNDELSDAALVHDIGKCYISSFILDKPAVLSKLEREIVDLHSYFGYEILKNLQVSEKLCRIVLYHHSHTPLMIHELEEYNDEDAYEKASLLHSIDAFEALTTDRPYRRGYSVRDALAIMKEEGNHHPKVIEYFDKTKDYR